MPIYYNPATRPDTPKTTIRVVGQVDPASRPYNIYKDRACVSYEAALARGVSGCVFWLDDGKLMEGHSTGAFEYQPLIEEPSFVGGMNWNDAYFFTEQAAEVWASNCGCRHDRVKYLEQCDVYKVHFHWIDNPDCMKGISHASETQDTQNTTVKRMTLQ